MAWTAEQMAQKRAKLQKKTNAAAGGAEPLSQRKSADSPPDSGALGSTGNSVSDNKSNTWTAEKMAEKRAALQTQKQQTGTDLYSTALEDYRTRNNLGFADAMDSRSDELNRQKVTVSPAEKMEQNASTVQKLREQRNNGIRMDVYSTVNNWKDASERNRELARLVTEPTLPRGAVSAADLPAGVDYLAADTGGVGIMPVLENTRYMDNDLKKMGYTQDEINRARLYMKAYNDLSLGERAGRRVESDLEGNKENIKGMIGQYAGALSPALTASAEEQMIRRVQSGRYTDEQLEAAGYDPELIRTAHERIRSGELYDKADDDSNRMKGLYEWGRDAHKAGENLTADAMAGESNVGRFFHGATSSAAENLIVSAINPALVLPVLSAHGAGDSMAASDEAGESPEKAILKGTAKFGAGWAINSVGVADLAKTMGSDYAKDTVAGTIADWVRRQVGNQAFREAYPAVANAISGGADNAMQAFVETYADKAIDAVMGDQEAAKTLFNKDTFLTALEAGLSGGASGALGGAVGTGLSRMNAGDSSLRGNVERYAAQDEYEQALKEHQRREELAREPGDGIAEQTVVNDDPAVHTAAQNASIEEYKNSVDPKMAEYVDKVRAGEKLEPYVVTRTSDRMRSAMMELTGLDKVGDYTLLDNNGVQHITNRHAGGDGSADATMKNSADVARAAYVLNNFDNAYLGTRKAEGYFDSRSKRAPIVIFEKKIDGSHIIVEAVTDTKRGKNYIISEYLSSVGVDPKEIAKTLRPPMDAAESDPRHTSETLNEEISAISASMPQSPMDAVADPRDTSKTLAEDYDATASIAPGEGSVNGNRVKNGVETVESTAETAADGNTPHPSAAQTASHQGEAFSSYADVENRVDAAQLNTADWNRGEQRAAARQLVNRAQMTTKAAQAVVDAMPQGVGAAVYAQAANSLYRMGVTQDVKSFEQAVNLTGGMNSLGGAVRQVLALGKTGENALRIAYTYGQGEAEAYNARKTSEIGSGQGAVNPDAGTYFKGRNVSKGTNAMDAFIELGAKSSGTAIHRAVEGLQNNARGFIKAAAGEMYLSGEAGSETVMHETFHMLNEWSPETGQAVMDRLLTYLVQQNGMESTEKLVESYLGRYEDSGVKMTWNQALEEITADAMETVFGTADGFRNFVRQQAAEAKMNAKARGMIGKVMDKIDSLLHTVLADVNRFLKNEPTNAAAKAARSLTEQQLKDLQNLYFEHQAEAGSKYREVLTSQAQSASSPNRGAKEQGSAEVKYSIDPSYAQDIDEWNRDGRNSREIFVLGSTAEALQGLGARENDIYMKGDKISLILEQHPEMTLNEIKRIPEILDDPILVLSSRNKGRAGSQNTRLVLFGSVKAQDGRPVLCVLDLQPVENRIVIQDMQKATSAYTKDNDPVRFVRNSEVLYTSENKKRTTALLRTLGFQMPSELQRYGSMGSISYHGQNVKMEGVPFTGIETQTKYQLDVDSDAAEATRTAALGDVDKQTDLMRQVSELGGKVRLSDQSITDIVRAVLSDTGSKLDAKTFTERMRALSDYIALNKDVSWDDVYTFASDIAEQLMQRSSHKNDEMWKHYPELHQMSMVIEKGSKDYSEILYHWGSWANARKELARRGVKITQSKEGVHSHWDADFTELQKLGAGLFPTETPNSAVEALEAMAEAHDTIRPVMQNDYSEDWDGAKQDIAMQIMLRYMNSTEVANEQNAEARQEFTKQWEEMRKQAKQEALEARAKVELERAKREQELKEAAESAADPFRLEAAKANARADKAEAFARKQRESVSTTIRLAKDRAEKQLQKARDAREMDTTRRNINKMTSQLTQMLEKPSEKGYVPEYLLEKVRPVAALANDAVGNRKAAAQLRAELNGTYGPVPEGGEHTGGCGRPEPGH